MVAVVWAQPWASNGNVISRAFFSLARPAGDAGRALSDAPSGLDRRLTVACRPCYRFGSSLPAGWISRTMRPHAMYRCTSAFRFPPSPGELLASCLLDVAQRAHPRTAMTATQTCSMWLTLALFRCCSAQLALMASIALLCATCSFAHTRERIDCPHVGILAERARVSGVDGMRWCPEEMVCGRESMREHRKVGCRWSHSHVGV